MKRFAVAGYPALHSASPIAFNAAFSHLGIDAHYLRISAPNAKEAVDLARALQIDGMNATAPLKETLCSFLDIADTAATQIQAVNTIVFQGNTVLGFNTDHIGVSQSLIDAGVSIDGKTALVLGAGGAGRAAVYGLINSGMHVILANRTQTRAQETANRLGCEVVSFSQLQTALKRADVIVGCVATADRVIDPGWLEPRHTVLDAVYPSSRLSEDASSAGCRTVGPLRWLLKQAAPAFERFVGRPCPMSVMEQALQSAAVGSSNNIALVGLMGSGKTTVGHHLSQMQSMNVFDTDVEVEKKTNMTVFDVFQNKGEVVFRRHESEVLQKVAQLKNTVIICGGGVVKVPQNIEFLRKNSAVIWLWAATDVLTQRVARSSHRPLLSGKDPATILERLTKERDALFFKSADLVVDTTHKSPKKVAEQIGYEIHKAFSC